MKRSRRSLTLAGVLAVLLLGLLTPTARAADPAPARDLQLRRLDSTDPDNVSVVFEYDGESGDVNGMKVAENGKSVTTTAQTLAEAKLQDSVVFLFDSSTSTDQSATLAEARKAVKAFMAANPGLAYAVVTAGSDVATVARFGSDSAAITKAIDQLAPSGDGALWEGVVRAASQYKDHPELIPNIVVITDGNSGTGTNFDSAVAAVNDAGGIAHVLAVHDDKGGLDSSAATLAQGSHGSYQETAKASDLTTLLQNDKARITGQYAFKFKSASPSGVNDLTLQVGGTQVVGSFVAGAVIKGASALAYQKPASSEGFTAMQNELGKLLAIVAALAAAGLAAYALLSALTGSDELSNALQPYASYRPAASGEDDDDDDSSGALAQTPLMQRAVELTEQLAERQGVLTKVEDALERANMPLRAAEAIFFYLVASVILAMLVFALTRNPLFALVTLPVAVLVAPTILNIVANRRRRQFESMLPDTLQLLSGTLRAGYSMMQGVEAVSQEVAEPMGRELRRVVTESRLGRPLEESLDAVAARMGSNDFAWATMAIRIQREVGGNLSELLMTVAETMTQRERLRRDVQTLTAEGRISAYVLGVLPIGLGAVMYTMNPDYMARLTDSGLGIALLAGAIVGMIGGFIWMNSIIKIEI